MVKIVNCTDQHVRILKAVKNGRLEVVRFFPTVEPSRLWLQPDEDEYVVDGMPVQPVKSVIVAQPDLEVSDISYIVDMDVAISLAERGAHCCLLVPCDPFLVRHLPSYTDEVYAGEYELLSGNLPTDDDVASLVSNGQKVYGYRRLLMVYAASESLDLLAAASNVSGDQRTANQNRLREAIREYQRLHQKWLNTKLASLRIKQREVDAVLLDGTTLSFQLNDADASRLLLFLDSLL